MRLLKKILKESNGENISKSMKYHLVNKIPLNENIYRIGSKKYVDLIVEARNLNSKGFLELSGSELFLAKNVGAYGKYKGERVPLNIPFKINESKDKEIIFGVFVNEGTKTKRVVFTKSMDRNIVSEYAISNKCLDVLEDFINSI